MRAAWYVCWRNGRFLWRSRHPPLLFLPLLEMDLKRRERIPKWNLIGETRGKYKAARSGTGGCRCASGSQHAHVNAYKATNSSLSLSPKHNVAFYLPWVAHEDVITHVERGEFIAQRETPFISPNQRILCLSHCKSLKRVKNGLGEEMLIWLCACGIRYNPSLFGPVKAM